MQPNDLRDINSSERLKSKPNRTSLTTPTQPSDGIDSESDSESDGAGDDKSGSGDERSGGQEREDGHDHDPRGALELESPGATLYRELFDRYVPEIADWLIRQRCVRFCVETAYNARVCGELLMEADGVTERTAYTMHAMAERLTNLLLKVCDQLADVYRAEHGYPARSELT